jgi:CheY-like chemotaxis protein
VIGRRAWMRAVRRSMWQDGLTVTGADRPPLALVVENERAIADSMGRLLEGMPLQTRTVPTGEAALAWIAKNQAPAVIILNLILPLMSGLDIVRRLRREKATSGVPIVVLTAHADEGEAAVRGGANAFVVKPGSREDYRLTIGRELAKERLVSEAIRESLSGLLSGSRATARAKGIVGRTVQLRVPLAKLLRLVKVRLDGLRGVDEPGDGPDSPFADGGGEIATAIEIDAPVLTDLRDRWLPALGVRVVGDDVELDVDVPEPRRAHAR